VAANVNQFLQKLKIWGKA